VYGKANEKVFFLTNILTTFGQRPMTIIIVNDFTVNSNRAVWHVRLFRRNGVIDHNLHHLRFNDNPETGKRYTVPIFASKSSYYVPNKIY